MTDGGGGEQGPEHAGPREPLHRPRQPRWVHPRTYRGAGVPAPNPAGGGRGRWVWDEKRPRYLGEDLFFTGNHPELATIGGEVATTGKSGTLKACGLMLSILQQGYRWADFAAWDFYLGPGDARTTASGGTSPPGRACAASGTGRSTRPASPVKRTIGVFNDTHHPDPITFAWELTVNGKKIGEESKEYAVSPADAR